MQRVLERLSQEERRIINDHIQRIIIKQTIITVVIIAILNKIDIW